MISELGLSLIHVGDRRREDMGDINALAASINRYGLLHPVVVDADGRLVAGGRRLEAVRSLGWVTIPVRALDTLTDAERREIELEENLRRKDLTEYEASRNMVAFVESVAHRQQETISVPSRNGNVGRPAGHTPGSLRSVAGEIGTSPQTILRAREHVAAVETNPDLAPLPQAEAIREHKRLTALARDEFFPAPTPAFDAFFKAFSILIQKALPSTAEQENWLPEDRERVRQWAELMHERIDEFVRISRGDSLRVIRGGASANQ